MNYNKPLEICTQRKYSIVTGRNNLRTSEYELNNHLFTTGLLCYPWYTKSKGTIQNGEEVSFSVFSPARTCHRHSGHKFEWAPGVGDGQGSLACCSPWGCKESDTTKQLN